MSTFVRALEECAHESAAELSTFEEQAQLVASDGAWSIVVTELSERDEAISEYASNDELDERFRREVTKCRFFILRFNSIEYARRVLRGVAAEVVRTGTSAWIDTDYGWVVHAWEVVAQTEREPSWDWRGPSGEMAP